MSYSQKYDYWIANWEINKRVISRVIQYYSYPGPKRLSSSARIGRLPDLSFFYLPTIVAVLICHKSKDIWEKQAVAHFKKESDRRFKQLFHQPIVPLNSSRHRSDELQD